jgi:hypothetical protein
VGDEKFIWVFVLAGWGAMYAFPQEKHEVTVINIAVPLTVFEGDRFVTDLRLDDLELSEEGLPQKSLALYLINPTGVEKMGAERDFDVSLRRNYFLLFQITEYNPKLAEAIDSFFQQAIRPGDSVIIHTPRQNYALSAQALASSQNVLAKEMNGLLKKTSGRGRAVQPAQRLEMARSISVHPMDVRIPIPSRASGSIHALALYKETVGQMGSRGSWMKRSSVCRSNRNLEAGKTSFYLPARVRRNPAERRQPDGRQLPDRPDHPGALHALFEDVSSFDRIKQAFSDAGISLYFIFMNKEPQNAAGITMQEQSEDVFKVFSQVAQATGGTVDTSQNPALGFQHALERSKNYYLLYYSPENYQKDGQFKNIVIRLKNPNYTVLHRMGYYAN